MKRTLEILSMLLIFGVVVLRPLISESYSSTPDSMESALEGLAHASSVRTIGIDVVILIAVCLWIWSTQIRPARPMLPTGIGIGATLLIIGAVLSCAAAGNKRLAINATVDWICLLPLTAAVAHLASTEFRRRILLAGIIASGCAAAVECIDYFFIQHDAVWEGYLEIRDEFWARQQVDPESASAKLFEARLLARESQGFTSHSSIAGSHLALCAVAAAAMIAVPRAAAGGHALLAFVARCAAALVIAIGLFLTRSIGAITAVGIAICFVVGLRFFSARRNLSEAATWGLAWLLIGAGALATVSYGLLFDTLPHMSLAFRWGYWKSSAGLFVDHALRGIGRENFGREYLAYKSIGSPEEVANPHNLLVQAGCDWGAFGLAGMVALMLGVSYLLMRRWPTPPEMPATENGDSTSLWWALAGVATVCVVRTPLLGSDDPNFVYATTVINGIVWLVTFLLFARPLTSVASGSEPDWLPSALSIALVGFLIHDLINFALFVPATATSFAAVLGIRLAASTRGASLERNHRRNPSRVLAWVSCVAPFTVALFVLVPVARSAKSLALARQQRDVEVIDSTFVRAAALDTLDPAPPAERAAWLQSMAHQDKSAAWLTKAHESIVQARRRDPRNKSLAKQRHKILAHLAQQTGRRQVFAEAIAASAEALALYPADPRGLIRHADALLDAGMATSSSDWTAQALANFREGLSLDDARPEWERLRRFTDRELEHIGSRQEQAKQQLARLTQEDQG